MKTTKAVFICVLLSVIIIFGTVTVYTYTEQSEVMAQELTRLCKFDISDYNRKKLTDLSFRTSVTYASEGQLAITCDYAIGGIYIEWDRPPGNWTVSAGETTVSCGENGFIHEYVRISPSKTVTLNIPSGTVVCEIQLFTQGNPPSTVQEWLPPAKKADILLFPAHADDEHLYFGGTMAYYAGELGYTVQVAYITNHWKEPRRPHELLDGLWLAGITNYPVISEQTDNATFSLSSAYRVLDADGILSYITEMLRRFRPYVAIGHDLDGEYGHGAHMLSALLLCQAADNCADPSFCPESAEKYGVYDVPKTYLHKYKENAIVMNWDIPLENFGGKTAFQMAQEGYDCHVSQKTYFVVERNGVGACTQFGLYRTTVGIDTGETGDFLENIVFKDEETEPAGTTEAITTGEITAPPETETQTERATTEAPVTEAPTTAAPETTAIETDAAPATTEYIENLQADIRSAVLIPVTVLSAVCIGVILTGIVMINRKKHR